MISHLLFTYILCLFKFCVELIYLCSIPLNALSIYENNYFVEAGSPRITISSSQKHGGDTYAVMNQDLRLLSHHMNNYLLLVYCNRILFLSNVTSNETNIVTNNVTWLSSYRKHVASVTYVHHIRCVLHQLTWYKRWQILDNTPTSREIYMLYDTPIL